MSKFLHHDVGDDAKAIAVPRVFSENSRAKNGTSSLTRTLGLLTKMPKLNDPARGPHLILTLY